MTNELNMKEEDYCVMEGFPPKDKFEKTFFYKEGKSYGPFNKIEAMKFTDTNKGFVSEVVFDEEDYRKVRAKYLDETLRKGNKFISDLSKKLNCSNSRVKILINYVDDIERYSNFDEKVNEICELKDLIDKYNIE